MDLSELRIETNVYDPRSFYRHDFPTTSGIQANLSAHNQWSYFVYIFKQESWLQEFRYYLVIQMRWRENLL